MRHYVNTFLKHCFLIKKVVRETGLEPVRPKTHAPQACLSADSSTLAITLILYIRLRFIVNIVLLVNYFENTTGSFF